ncbi:MAG: class I SAM-dependent methyltransferase [Anaerofustis stercorihominis]|nr:class I SAM-dependent methyltransferase [Anaerofustis stercorihominis]
MNSTNKTAFIPLYGKSYVSKQNIILNDKKAEEIWQKEAFPLKGKARSKWLAFYMGMRASVIDDLTNKILAESNNTVVIHLGCGLDSRCLRVNDVYDKWYDIDMEPVVDIRRNYYDQTNKYEMVSADVTDMEWISYTDAALNAVVVMEGISMYLPQESIYEIFSALGEKYPTVHIIMDAYTNKAVRLSKLSNPIDTVDASAITGIDDPDILNTPNGVHYCKKLSITPEEKINELQGFDKLFFRYMFAGKFADSLYRLYYFCNQD